MDPRDTEGASRLRNLAAALLLPMAVNMPLLRRPAWRAFYQLFAAVRPESFSLMNYGYAGAENMALSEDEEPERYATQLYCRVVSGVELAGKEVLEVGCGRGGGTAFLARRFRPKRLIGIDIAPRAVQLCRDVHREDGLSFETGDAMAMPFPADAFDIVVNIESAFCYPSRPRFYSEVHRVLRPGGRFLYADIEDRDRVATLEAQLASAGLAIEACMSINREVIAACDRDGARRTDLVATLCRSRIARSIARNFAAIPGSAVYKRLASGRRQYMVYRATSLRGDYK